MSDFIKDLERSTTYYDGGDDADESLYMKAVDALDWKGLDVIDDSSNWYKKKIRVIHDVLSK